MFLNFNCQKIIKVQFPQIDGLLLLHNGFIADYVKLVSWKSLELKETIKLVNYFFTKSLDIGKFKNF